MQDFRDKVAVVTGGASGIGRAMVDRFAQAGMRIVIADVEASALASAERELRDRGVKVLGVKTDVAKPDEVEALAAKAVEQFGGVHVLCNNAGVSVRRLMGSTRSPTGSGPSA